MQIVLIDLLQKFGTFENCIIKEKLECQKWKDYKIKQKTLHNISWNINCKNNKKNKNDSSIKININIPLKIRCI